MKKLHNRRRGQAGFTLIELLMVVAIIGFLMGTVAFSVGRTKYNAQRNACQTERLTFETASNVASLDAGDDIRSYLQDPQGEYFEAQGQTGFVLRASSPLAADCT